MRIVPIPDRKLEFYGRTQVLYSQYMGPFNPGKRDIRLRRSRVGRLIWLGIRKKGWRPKLGLYKARKYGPGFRKAQQDRIALAFNQCMQEQLLSDKGV
jgi:hypothetical protein